MGSPQIGCDRRENPADTDRIDTDLQAAARLLTAIAKAFPRPIHQLFDDKQITRACSQQSLGGDHFALINR